MASAEGTAQAVVPDEVVRNLPAVHSPESAYERGRRERVRRNRELLHRLGLTSSILESATPKSVGASVTRPSKRPRTASATLADRGVDRGAVWAPRRSRRLAARPTRVERAEDSDRSGTSDAETRVYRSSTSTKQQSCQLSQLQPYLGRAVPVPPQLGGQVKRSVIDAAATATHPRPRFNRMSGVCEWRDAVMLFVNLPADRVPLAPDNTDAGERATTTPPSSTGYANSFYQDGRLVVWFAQRTHTVGAPLIRRLRSTGTDRDGDAILLFCRLPPPHDRAYLYFGRLAHVRHDVHSTPIRFVFRLLEYPALVESCGALSAALRGDYPRAWRLAQLSRRDRA